MSNRFSTEQLIKDVQIQTSRSGGAGGQHVNKVETKVQMFFDLSGSELLSDHEKQIIRTKFHKHINAEGYLIVSSEKHRSQLKNKETALNKLRSILESATVKSRVRKPTKPTKASVRKRLKSKKIQSERKKFRGKFDHDN